MHSRKTALSYNLDKFYGQLNRETEMWHDSRAAKRGCGIDEALQCLSERARYIAKRKFIDDATCDVIAQELDITVQAVAMHTKRIKLKLQEKYTASKLAEILL